MRRAVSKTVAVLLLISIICLAAAGCMQNTRRNTSPLAENTPIPTPTPTEKPKINLNYDGPKLIDKDVILQAVSDSDLPKYPEDISVFGYIFNRTLIAQYADTDAKKEFVLGLYAFMLTSRENYRLPENLGIDAEELKYVMNMLDAEAPEILHVDQEYKYYTSNDYVVRMSLSYTYTPSQYLEMLEGVFDFTDSITADFSPEISDFDKELAIYDAITENCIYDLEGSDNISNAYGACVSGAAICEGYSDAFTLAMYMCDIPCHQVWGDAQNSEGEVQSHAWNRVFIGGDWYNTDITWDDPKDKESTCLYAYFNITDDEAERNHFPDEVIRDLGLEECTQTTYNYHTYFGLTAGDDKDGSTVIIDILEESCGNKDKKVTKLLKFTEESAFSDFKENFESDLKKWIENQPDIKSVEFESLFDSYIYVLYIRFDIKYR